MLSWLGIRCQILSSVKISFLISRARLPRPLPRNRTSRFVILNIKLHSCRVAHRRNNFSWYDKFCSNSFCTFLKQFLFILRRLLTSCVSFLHVHFFMKSLRSLISDFFFLLRYFVLLLELYWWHTPVPLEWNISLLLSHILCRIYRRSPGISCLLLRLLSSWFLALRDSLICPISVQFLFNSDELCCIEGSGLFRSIFSAHFW